MLPVLTTERLVLRPWRGTDAAAAFEIYSQWDVARYLGTTPRAMSDPAEAEAAVARWAALGPRYGTWAIVPIGQDAPVGSALLKLLPASGTGEPTTDVEVGWHLRPEVWGRGYATEAGRCLLEYAWTHGTREVFAVTYPDNAASQAVCERLGMERLGPTDRYYGITCELFRARPPGGLD
jgi:RimJ/RimL family protein N-acetyltransferase